MWVQSDYVMLIYHECSGKFPEMLCIREDQANWGIIFRRTNLHHLSVRRKRVKHVVFNENWINPQAKTPQNDSVRPLVFFPIFARYGGMRLEERTLEKHE